KHQHLDHRLGRRHQFPDDDEQPLRHHPNPLRPQQDLPTHRALKMAFHGLGVEPLFLAFGRTVEILTLSTPQLSSSVPLPSKRLLLKFNMRLRSECAKVK